MKLTLRPFLALCLSLGFMLGPARTARAAVPEASAKAALVFNLTKFVAWPDTAKGPAFRIGILGPDPFGTALEEIVQGEQVDGRAIVIKRSSNAASLADCQLVYVSPNWRQSPANALGALRGRGILTVGESEGFLSGGGMVRLVRTPERKVRLQIHLDNVRAESLRMSAQLLRVAEVVKGGSE